MRVQYTKAENEAIEFSRKENKNFDGIVIPVEGQGEDITLGLHINDVHKFNMFIASWITDQGKEDSHIANEIGADIIHIDYRAPIKTEYLLFLKNYIDGILYGPTPEPVPVNEDQPITFEKIEEESEAPEEGEQQELLEEGESVTFTTPQSESGLIVDDSVSPIAEDSTPE